MMPKNLYKALQQCIKLLDSGVPAEECLAKYPRHSDELRPLLAAASEPNTTFHDNDQDTGFQMPFDAKLRVRRRVLEHWDRLHAPKQSWWMSFGWSTRWAAAAAVLVIMLMVGGVGTVAAAQDSVPGSGLYTVKQLQEEARLWFTRSPQEKVAIYSEYSRERAREIIQLMQSDQQDLAVVSITRLEEHLTAVDAIWAESASGSSTAGLSSSAIIETLGDVLLSRDEGITVADALNSTSTSAYPCLQHTLQILGSAREQVNSSLEAVGRTLPQGASRTYNELDTLCPR